LTHLAVVNPAALEGEVLGPQDCVRVVGIPHAFAVARVERDLPAGLTVAELLRETLGHLPLAAHVSIGMEGREATLERRHWHRVRPRPGARLTFRVVPLGGGNTLRSLLLLTVVIAAAFFAPYLAGAIGFTAGSTGFSIASGLIGMAINAVGNYLLNALFPIKPPKLSDQSSGDSVSSISGARNQADPWGPVPLVLGRHRVHPKYAANPWTEIVGDDQYLRLLFCFGYGPLEIEDMRIGTTPALNFEGVEIEVRNGYDDDEPLTLYPNQVFEQTFDILMEGPDSDSGGEFHGNPGDWFERTTATGVVEISVDFTCPRGLFRTTDKGKKDAIEISYQAQYRAVGSGTWLDWVDEFRKEAESMQPVRFTHRKTVAEGQYEVRCRKNMREVNEPNHTDEIRWTVLRGLRNAPPVNSEVPLCLVAMRVRASDQLNGTIDTFNAIATSILPDWDATASPPAWVERATRNPASMFRAILQGPANARPVVDDDIDLDRLVEWHGQCSDEGWNFDQYRDFTASAYDALSDVASAARAAVTLRDGRWGVMTDDPDAPVVQHFTPRNSSGFNSERAYREFPHAWRVRFINEARDWAQDERIVYDAGYDENTATRFEGLEFPGVTSADNVWRHGRFHLAQVRLRPETYSFDVDFEGLVCSRGDRIRFSHDVPLFGGGAGRVKSIAPAEGGGGGGGWTVELDELVSVAPATSHVIRFRTATGDSLLFDVVASPGERRRIVIADPGGSPVALPDAGDLWMFGENGLETVDLAVLAIEPAADMKMRIICVDWAPEISDADSGEIPEYDSQVSLPVDLRGRLAPGDLRFSESLVRSGPVVESVAWLSWKRPAVSGPPPSYEVQHRLTGASGWQPGSMTLSTSFRFVNLDGDSYDFRVRTLGPNNSFSDWAVLSGQTLEGLLAPPADVAGLTVQIVGTLATLSWPPVGDLDFSHYEVRYQPVTTGALWHNALVLADNVAGTSLQTAAQTGTWLVKAVDTSGVESENAALVVSNVAALAGLNVVELLDEAASSPAFAGVAQAGSANVVTSSGQLRLDDVSATIDDDNPQIEGVYVFDQALDLGEVFTSRLTGLVQVSGVDLSDDVFARADWFGVADYFGGLIDGYEVELQARWTSDDPASSPVSWSAWAAFLVMDVTARAFEFRLILRSFQTDVTPLVSALSVEVDMPDRVASDEDITVPDTGLRVTYAPAFRARPAVAVSLQNLVSGDYYAINPATADATGFDIVCYDSTDSAVARVIDWVAHGYGAKNS
jgi:ribosomal protein L12E/L44/L45/RPP1/RPP2